jgi:hypothetical protein
MNDLPAGFSDAHDLALGSQFPETYPADLEKSEITAGAAAKLAPVISANPFFGLATLCKRILHFALALLGLDD